MQDGGILTDAKNFYNNVYTALKRLEERDETVQLDSKEWNGIRIGRGLAGHWTPAEARRQLAPQAA